MAEVTTKDVPPIEVRDEKYWARLASEGGRPVVRFHGTVSTAYPSLVLNPFVDQVHAAVSEAGAEVVTVDFGEFEFCNSSGFKSLIYWVDRIRGLPEGRRYRLRFVLAPARRWQKTSLLALTCFAVDTIEIAS